MLRLLALLLVIPRGLAWSVASRGISRSGAATLVTSSRSRSGRIVLDARVAKKEEETTKELAQEDGFMTVPYEGLVGAERGGLFDTPLKIFDAMNDIDSVGGEDGSDEQMDVRREKHTYRDDRDDRLEGLG
jgi:hypothetical protein